MPPRLLHTIGHSTRSSGELIALLRAHGVERVVDVRRFPGSRRHPQFSKERLAASLADAGIDYAHEEALGGRRPVLADSLNTGLRNRGFRGYADYMGTDEFMRALDRLVRQAADRSAAILCAEAVPWQCHRNMVADALVARGVEVRHILSADRAQAHVLNALARVRPDGTLVYAAERLQTDLLD